MTGIIPRALWLATFAILLLVISFLDPPGQAGILPYLFYLLILITGFWFHAYLLPLALASAALYSFLTYRQAAPIDEILMPSIFILLFAGIFNHLNHERQRQDLVQRDLQEKYRLIVEKGSDVPWILDIDSMHFSYISPAASRLTGYSPEEWEEIELADFLPPEWFRYVMEVVPQRIDLFQKDTLSNHTYKDEIEIVNKDGSTRWVENVTTFSHDEQGKLVLSGISRDITERKALEKELRFFQAVMEAFFAHTPNLLNVFDQEGRYLLVSHSITPILGYTPGEVQGKYFQDFLPPEEARRFCQNIEKLLQKEEPLAVTDIITTPGGEKGYTTWLFPLGLKEQGKELIGSVAMDISESRRLAQELEQSRQMLNTVLDTIPVRIFWKGPDLRYLGCNLSFARDAGFSSPAEITGRRDIEMPWSDYAVEFNREDREILQQEREHVNNEHQMTLPGTGTVWLRSSKVPLRDAGGDIIGIIGMYEDITAEKEHHIHIRQLSYCDQLTGLYNRRYFEEELRRLDRAEDLPLSLLLLDVNGLKLFNDAFGHLAGDRVLKEVGQVMQQACRPRDIIARIGGDEYIIILPRTSSQEVKELAAMINRGVAARKVESINLSISYGWGTKERVEDQIIRVFKEAEDHMYRRKLYESKSIQHTTIEIIMKTLHEKNAREQEHSVRVSKLCEAMGEALRLGSDDIAELRTVGLMHDIGKITLEGSYLDKPGSLDEEELREFRRHCETGYRILSTVNEYAPLAEYVLAHHERWDGGGYPRGLKGEAIPLEARIIAVADAYDAMTSERPYRQRLDPASACREIMREAGSQFDPHIARVFVEEVIPAQEVRSCSAGGHM